ncbi:MAG: CHAD domain-containing protein [Pararhodobacter sp.]
MSYSFDPAGPSVQAQMRRIALEVLDRALKTPVALRTAAQADPAEVHALRKATKKLRGLLRLIKPSFAQFGPANQALRDAARLLAPLRDAEVMLATLARLEAQIDPPADTAALHIHLDARIAMLRSPEQLAEAAASLRACLVPLRAEIPGWRLTGKGFAALEPGLATSWRAARRGLKRAGRAFAADLPAEPFHEWRKVVKHHSYHARLLQPVWPAMMAPHFAAADALGEVLGEHNDLDGLVAFLRASEHGLSKAAQRRLIARAERRRHKLAKQALADGRRLFIDPPDALCARWRGWWQEARHRG